MSADLSPYEVDFSAFLNRDQAGNAVAWSLDQFRDKPVYLQVLQAFVAEINDLYVSIAELGKARTIFGATGVWLDGIGRIVGQPRELTPVDMPDGFFYWDDDGTGTRPTGITGSAHFYDSHFQWLTGALVSANSTPTDNDYRSQIIRRIFQNMNQNSSSQDIIDAVKAVLGLDCQLRNHGLHEVVIRVPVGTPDFVIYYLSAKSFGVDEETGTFNRWWLPFPACTNKVTVEQGAFL